MITARRLLGAACVAAFSCLVAMQPMPAEAGGASLMRYIQPWCVEHGGDIGHRLDNGKIIDCRTEKFAVEFARAAQWETAIGGALYRAAETGLEPSIVLIIGDGDMTYAARLHKTVGMQVWTVRERPLPAWPPRAPRRAA